MLQRMWMFRLFLIGMTLLSSVTDVAAPRVVEKLDIAPVWAGDPVGFDFITHGQQQFVAFYDAQRRLTVACRSLDSNRWTFQVLPTSVGWDSHNYICMAI